MEEQQQALTRVSNYPIVRDTWTKVNEVYQKGKDGNSLIRFCGNVAESSVALAYKATQPVLEKLPVATVNGYAVQKLEDLEKKYPIVTKPTDEMVKAVKTYSMEKLDECKTYGTDQFNRLAEVAHLNSVLNIADAAVDKFLPAVDSETAEKEKKTPEIVVARPEASTQLRVLTNKVRRRAYDNAMSKIGGLQKRSQEAVGKLMYTVDLIDYAQENMRNVTLNDCKEKVKQYYDEITREDTDGEMEELSPDATLERKTLYVARSLTLRARTTFRNVSRLAYTMPSNVRSKVTDALTYADNLYQSFLKTNSFKDFSADMLAQLRQKVSFLEEVAGNLTQYILESTPLRWLVLDFELGTFGAIEPPEYTYGWNAGFTGIGNGYAN